MLVKAVDLTKEQEAKLQTLIDAIPQILGKVKNKPYDEIFGYRINVAGEEFVDEQIRNEILLKFLVANDYDVDVTITKLAATLDWRAEFDPLSTAYNENYDEELNALGAITILPNTKLANYAVATWNLYGNMKTPKKLFEKFGGSDSKKPGSQFLRWRVGLMEKSLAFVDFTDPRNHKIVQVHDYNGVSMFRVDKGMRAATKEIISIFGDNYPELLTTKFFVNVPTFMSWMFTFFTSLGIISAATVEKFKPLNHGNLSQWYGAGDLPKAYNGGAASGVASLFSIDRTSAAKPPAYAQHLLEKKNDKEIEDNLLSVE